MAILRVKAGPHKGKVFEVTDKNLVVGRDVTDGIQVMDQGVSRQHAEILRIGEMYFIRDLGSRNGTFVNDKTVKDEILRVGDQVRIGNSVLVFEDRFAHLKDSKQIITDAPPNPAMGDLDPSSTISLTLTSVAGVKKSKEKSPETTESKSLRVLFNIASIMNEEKDLSRLLSRSAEVIGKTLEADHVSVLWTKAEADTFEILGRYDREFAQGGAGCVSRSIMKDCLKFGRSVLTADASMDKQLNTMATVVMKQLRSVICVPISLLGENRGVLYVYSKKSEAFSSEDLELAAAVGIELGTAIGLLKMIRNADAFFRNSIKAIVSAIDTRNPNTRGKSQRLATYCLSIAKELGLDTHNIRNAWLAGMLHDIGSIPLSDKELGQGLVLEAKKNHNARELLKQVPTLEAILPAVESQNERWDGSGSPEGKKGKDIPILGRILGLSLELDGKLHKDTEGGKEMTIKDALLKLKDTADRQFDKETLNALFRAYRNARLFDQEEEFFEIPLN